MSSLNEKVRAVAGILLLPAALLSGCDCGGRPVTPAPGEIAADPASLDFGLTVPGRPVERSVAISNQGAGPLTIQELVIAGDAAASFSVKAPDSPQLSGGGSLSLIVSYAPSAEGNHLARLLVRSDAANTRELLIPLAGSASSQDPCAKLTCNQPPGPCYQATGSCSNGSCAYLPKADNTPCDDGNSCTDADVCQAGLCRGTPKGCTTPPVGTCKDASSFTAYASPGVCVGGVCQYTSSTQTCAGGCANNVCSPDPCLGVTCNSPPPCFRGGSCVGGACQYQADPGALCDDGNACTVGDMCDSIGICAGTPKSCQSPPAAACVDAQTWRSYDAVGSCGAGGVCSYVSHDTLCPLGCDAATGQCKTGCNPGLHLCSGQCVAEGPQSCGPSCAVCTAPANGAATCANAVCDYTCNAGFGRCATGCCPVTTATALAAGFGHNCVITGTGGIKCWGYNSDGQIGDGTRSNLRLTPVDVVGFTSGAQAVAVGTLHSCALTGAGGVKCWGDNWNGQIGDGSGTPQLTPVNVVGFASGVQAIATFNRHTCALTSTGGVKCWGYNSDGQIGDGTSGTDRPTPVNVSGLGSGVQAISAGLRSTCALTATGGVKCWGFNASGELGDGTTTNRSTPVDVVGLTSGVRAISVGDAHACALTIAGGVTCWGLNAYGQIGDGSRASRLTPVNVSGLGTGVQAISTGNLHTCALLTGGGVKCWGWNAYGQIGDGTSGTNRLTPTDVVGLASGVQGISAGTGHSCGLTSVGGIRCWGWNAYGQIGDGTSGTNRLTPVGVLGF